MTARSRWRRLDARSLYEAGRGPNMTPMVDVVMVILVFFMASTVILGPEMLLAAGLESGEAPPAEADPRFAIDDPVFEVRLAVGPGRGVAVSGLGLSGAPLEGLPPAAAALARSIPPERTRLVIIASDDTPYEAVVRAQDMLSRAGFDRVGLR